MEETKSVIDLSNMNNFKISYTFDTFTNIIAYSFLLGEVCFTLTHTNTHRRGGLSYLKRLSYLKSLFTVYLIT